MVKFEFWLGFRRSCLALLNWQYDSIGSDDGLMPTRRQAIPWSNDGLVYLCIYFFGLNELSHADVSSR